MSSQARVIVCDVLIVGGTAGGTAAALAAVEAGAQVCLIEHGAWLGGQLTTQGVCTPDEHQHIETFGGTRRYYAFRNAVRDYYRAQYHLSPAGEAQSYLNPGQCWVSRLSYEPRVGAEILRDMLRPYETSEEDTPKEDTLKEDTPEEKKTGRLHLFLNTNITACEMSSGPLEANAEDNVQETSFPDTITAVIAETAEGSRLRLTPRYILDATDMGDVLALCGREGVDWVVGAEAQSDTGEPDAPPEARPHWVQPFTFPFALEWSPETQAANIIERPHDYEELKALQDYKIMHGAITGLFTGRAPWWQYRRILARENFDDPRIPHDVAMINTAGNDYYGGNILGPDAGTPADIQATLARARRVSLGYVYWLQTECPREETAASAHSQPPSEQKTVPSRVEGQEAPSLLSPQSWGLGGDGPVVRLSYGYPEFRLRTDLFDTEDGCAPEPYIRESRRIKSLRPVLEQEIVVKDFQGAVHRGEKARAAFMSDSVGVGHYALDIHPNGHGEPNHFVATRPFQIPLGALIPVRLTNLLPACKNIGTTHLTNGAYRLHPIEWNIGESAGLLAAFCAANNAQPAEVYQETGLRSRFQKLLLDNGIALNWYIDVPLEHPAFAAVQILATTGLALGSDTDLLFHPDEPITAEDWQAWRMATGAETASSSPAMFTGTRAEAALALIIV